jgi:hypothetical protein
VNGAALDLDLDRDRQRFEEIRRLPVHRALGLHALRAQVLAEITLAMQERDARDRHVQVCGRTQDVTGEDAESTAVGRNAGIESDLHREVTDFRAQHGRGHAHGEDLLLPPALQVSW